MCILSRFLFRLTKVLAAISINNFQENHEEKAKIIIMVATCSGQIIKIVVKTCQMLLKSYISIEIFCTQVTQVKETTNYNPIFIILSVNSCQIFFTKWQLPNHFKIFQSDSENFRNLIRNNIRNWPPCYKDRWTSSYDLRWENNRDRGSAANCRPGMVGLAPKWVRLAPNGTNPGLFQIRFQCIWRV